MTTKEIEAVQHQCYINWINLYLAEVDEKVTDLTKDFRTGETLRTFLILLSGKKLPGKFAKNPSFKIHKIANLQRILEFFALEKIPTHNIKPEDIENGDLKTINSNSFYCFYIQDLMNYVAIHYHLLQGKSIGSAKNITLMRNELIEWIASKTKITIENFNTDFEDGKVLWELYTNLCSNPQKTDDNDLQKKYEIIMNGFLKEFNIPILISPENLSKVHEETTLMMYLMFLKLYDESKEMLKVEVDKSLLEEDVPSTPRSMTTPRRQSQMDTSQPEWAKKRLKHINDPSLEKKSGDFRGSLKRTESVGEDVVFQPLSPKNDEQKKLEEKKLNEKKDEGKMKLDDQNKIKEQKKQEDEKKIEDQKNLDEVNRKIEQQKIEEQQKLEQIKIEELKKKEVQKQHDEKKRFEEEQKKQDDEQKRLEEEKKKKLDEQKKKEEEKQHNEKKRLEAELKKQEEQKGLQEEKKKKLDEQNKQQETKKNQQSKSTITNDNSLLITLQEKLKLLEESLSEKTKQNERLITILESYKPFVPKQMLRDYRQSEEEHQVSMIQRFLKRKKNTQKFVKLSEKYIPLISYS